MTTQQEKTTTEPQVNAYAIIVLVLCALTWGASFISRSVWNSAIASESTLTSLGITAMQAGGIATAFYIGYVISNFISGYLIDAVGARWSLAITALGTGAATILICFTQGYWIMFILRVLAGIFAGPLFSAIQKFNYAYFPNKFRAVVVGAMGAGPAVGTALASAWFTPLVAERGYVIAFMYAGIVTVAVGVIVLFALKDRGVTKPIRQMEGLSDDEKAKATKNAVKVFMQKDFIIGSVGHFLCMCGSTGMQTWILAYLINVKGLTPVTAGMVFASSQILGLVSGTLVGIINDALKTRKKTMVAGSLLYAVLFYGYMIIDSVLMLTVLSIVLRLVSGLVGSSSNTMQVERAKGPYSGKVMGWYNAICQLGSVVMPTVLGAIFTTTGNYGTIVTAIAAVYVLIFFVALLMKDTYGKEFNVTD